MYAKVESNKVDEISQKQTLWENLPIFTQSFVASNNSAKYFVSKFLGLFAYFKKWIKPSCFGVIWVSVLLTLDNWFAIRISKYYRGVHGPIELLCY